jgi:N-acetylglutamate synthase-like GNAT family acetyltransferase
MTAYKYIKINKDNKELIKSYDRFTQRVFNFNLEYWRIAGHWKNQYVPNSLVENNQVIANVSASIMQLQLNNKPIQAIQLGSVGALPEYRGKGLARGLMDKVLEEYKQFPLIFLFASDDVSGFYVKCGFRRVDESLPFIRMKNVHKSIESIRISRDSEHIKRLLSSKLQHSAIIDARGNESIYRFHLMYNFSDNIFYIEEKDIVFVADYEDDTVNIYDIMSANHITFDEIKHFILKKNTKKVRFHFTPDWLNVEYETEPINDNALYVHGKFLEHMENYKFPATAIT